MNTAILFEKHQTLLNDAIKHPFLKLIQQGKLEDKEFNRWLQQDYAFVLEFTRLVASLLEEAPSSHFVFIIDGLKAISNEKLWFEEELKKRNLSLDPKIHENCFEYLDFLKKMRKSTYSMKLFSIFAIEYVYERAWDLGLSEGPYEKISKRWNNNDFSIYVKKLESITNDEIQKADSLQEKEIDNAFQNIMILEKKFWDMAFL